MSQMYLSMFLNSFGHCRAVVTSQLKGSWNVLSLLEALKSDSMLFLKACRWHPDTKTALKPRTCILSHWCLQEEVLTQFLQACIKWALNYSYNCYWRTRVDTMTVAKKSKLATMTTIIIHTIFRQLYCEYCTIRSWANGHCSHSYCISVEWVQSWYVQSISYWCQLEKWSSFSHTDVYEITVDHSVLIS